MRSRKLLLNNFSKLKKIVAKKGLFNFHEALQHLILINNF
jgi:hypothetical protein